MNEVFLEGTVVSITMVEHAASVKPHCVCQLRVAHRNQKQQMMNELYTINAWNHLAKMGSSNVAVWNACVRERLFDAAHTAERDRNGSDS